MRFPLFGPDGQFKKPLGIQEESFADEVVFTLLSIGMIFLVGGLLSWLFG